MTGQPATRTVRRDTLLEKMRTQGYESADRDAQRIKDATGLDMFPRGQALVDYVTAAMRTAKTAADITDAIGYRVDRCSQRLAECGHAPLARLLMERDHADRRTPYIVLSIDRTPPAPEPVVEQVSTKRPAPNADEMLWELEDAVTRGTSFDEVADMFGIKAASLQRRLERLGVADQARQHFPRLGQADPVVRSPWGSSTPTGNTCREGHQMWAIPGRRARCRECSKAYKSARKRAAA